MGLFSSKQKQSSAQQTGAVEERGSQQQVTVGDDLSGGITFNQIDAGAVEAGLAVAAAATEAALETTENTVEDSFAFAAGSQQAANEIVEDALVFAGEAATQASETVTMAFDAQAVQNQLYADLSQAMTADILAFGGEAQQASYDFAAASVGAVSGLLTQGQNVAAGAIQASNQVALQAMGIVSQNTEIIERTASSAVDALQLGQANALEMVANQAEDNLIFAGGAIQQISDGYTVAMDEIQESAQSESAQGIENVVSLTQNVLLGLAALLGAAIFLARR